MSVNMGMRFVRGRTHDHMGYAIEQCVDFVVGPSGATCQEIIIDQERDNNADALYHRS
jgi:hypothetical protein